MKLTGENYKQLDILFQQVYDEHIFLSFDEDILIQGWKSVFIDNVNWETLEAIGIKMPSNETDATEMYSRIADAFDDIVSDAVPSTLNSSKDYV